MTHFSFLPSLINSSTCWFCEQESADIKDRLELTMRKNLRVEERGRYIETTYKQHILCIPRCSTCSKNKSKLKILGFSLALLPFIFFIFWIPFIRFIIPNMSECVFLILIGLVWLPIIILFLKIKPKLDYPKPVREHPEYKTLKENGYSVIKPLIY